MGRFKNAEIVLMSCCIEYLPLGYIYVYLGGLSKWSPTRLTLPELSAKLLRSYASR